MKFSDKFFNKVENKTNVKKEDIVSLAEKLQQTDMKNEGTLREVIQSLCSLTGKEISKENEDNIINTIKDDKIPNNVDKLF